MNAKIRKRTDIPAGMFSGVEAFVVNNKAYALVNGERIDYKDLSPEIKGPFSKAFKKDWKLVLKLWPDTSAEQAFVNWLNCKCGKLDGTPDLNQKTGEIIADMNSFCGNCYCAGAGKICKLPYDLKPYQVATIQYVHRGFTRDQIATLMCKSPETIKSRLEGVRKKLNAINTPNLVSQTPLIPSL